MTQRGFKTISALETAFFFITALVWTIGEDIASRVPLVVVGWLLFLSCAIKLVALVIKMDKKYSAAVCGIAFVFDMALIAAALTLFFLLIGFDAATSGGGLFSDILMVVLFIILGIAEAASFICSVVDGVDRFEKE